MVKLKHADQADAEDSDAKCFHAVRGQIILGDFFRLNLKSPAIGVAQKQCPASESTIMTIHKLKRN